MIDLCSAVETCPYILFYSITVSDFIRRDIDIAQLSYKHDKCAKHAIRTRSLFKLTVFDTHFTHGREAKALASSDLQLRHSIL